MAPLRLSILRVISVLLPGFLLGGLPHASIAQPDWEPLPIDDESDMVIGLDTGDLDLDGDLDIAAADHEAGQLTVYWNEDGVYTAELIAGELVQLRSCHVVDMDGDGRPDVLTKSLSTSSIRWYSYLDGAWIETVTNVSNLTDKIAPADVDGDGDMDVVATALFDYRVVLLTQGDGGVWTETTLSAPWVFSHPGEPSFADMDQDGDLDILLAGYDGVVWWANHGDGGWVLQTIVNRSNYDLHATGADLDGDNDTDVVVSTLVAGVEWFEQTGPGQWEAHPIDDVFQVGWVDAADIDLDGDIDLAHGSGETGEVFALWNDGSGSFTTQLVHTGPSPNERVVIRPLNDDPWPDLISGYHDTGVRSFIQQASGLWLQVAPLDPPAQLPPGETLHWTLELQSFIDEVHPGVFWVQARFPGGGLSGPLISVPYVFGPGTNLFLFNLLQPIPLNAPLGSYEYIVHIGTVAGHSYVSDSFDFEVVESAAAPAPAGSFSQRQRTSEQHWHAELQR